MSISLRRIGIACALACTAPWASAQAPTTGNPLDKLPPAQKTPPPVDPAKGPRLDVQAPAGPSGSRLTQTVVPRRFDVQGVNALPFEQIVKLFAPLARHETSVATLVARAREGTALYREAGYPLAFVYVPEQDFRDGVVRVVAVEGYIADVRIEGDAGAAEPRLRALAARLLTERPLTQASFERATQLINRLPGLSTQATASLPGRTDGATTLVLKVQRQPYNLSLGADLRRPTPRAVLTGVWNDPLASGSQLSASTLLGDYRREKLLSLAYTQFVGSDGWMIKASHSNYRGYPDQQMDRGAAVERFNTNRRTELSANYPLLLNAHTSLLLSSGFYAVDNVDDYRVRASGARLTEETRMRALFSQLAYADVQSERSRSASVMLAQGLRGAGAQADASTNVPGLLAVNAARTDFTRVAVDASQRDRWASRWGTAVSFGAQYSAHALAASERISFGGVRFGRGYAAGDAAGDSGWGIGFELNRAFDQDYGWLKQIEPYLLLEAAQVSTHNAEPAVRKLRSVALGVRLTDKRHYTFDLALAKPTGDAAPSNPARKPRLTLLLSYQLEAL